MSTRVAGGSREKSTSPAVQPIAGRKGQRRGSVAIAGNGAAGSAEEIKVWGLNGLGEEWLNCEKISPW